MFDTRAVAVSAVYFSPEVLIISLPILYIIIAGLFFPLFTVNFITLSLYSLKNLAKSLSFLAVVQQSNNSSINNIPSFAHTSKNSGLAGLCVILIALHPIFFNILICLSIADLLTSAPKQPRS